MTVYEDGIYKNHFYEIVYDDAPPSPREWDNLGTFCVTMWFNESDVRPHEIKDDPKRGLEEYWAEPVPVILPVYKMQHSMIALRTTPFSCPWDSGQIGWIYATRSDILKNFGRQRLSARQLKMTEDILTWEVIEMSNYLNGDVYGYRIYQEDELVDSCFGFYDGIKLAKEALQGEIDARRQHLMQMPVTRAPIIQMLGA